VTLGQTLLDRIFPAPNNSDNTSDYPVSARLLPNPDLINIPINILFGKKLTMLFVTKEIGLSHHPKGYCKYRIHDILFIDDILVIKNHPIL
jgi:hypothetical protein